MLRLEVVSLVPIHFDQCATCTTMYDQAGIGVKIRDEMAQEYPPDLLQEHVRLSFWVLELSQRYGPEIQIRIIDPQSVPGFFKCLRHRVFEYPTFIVNGKRKYTGWDKQALDKLLEEILTDSQEPVMDSV